MVNKRVSEKAKRTLSSWLLLLPGVALMSLFTVYPIFKNIYLSFCKTGFRYKVPKWVGTANFGALFADPVFWKVLRNTIAFSLMTVLPSMIIGFLLAIILNSKFRGLRFLRTAYFYPVVMPMIAVACIWRYLYMPENGMFSSLIYSIFHVSIGDVLSRTDTVLPALAIMYVWKEIGYVMIFFLSGLQNMSEEYFEAAMIDGGNFRQILTRITVPLMAPTTLFVTMIEITNSIKLVDHVVILTQGKPNNGSNLLMHYIYQLGYEFFDQGKASAVTSILLVVLLLISLPRFFSSDSSIHYS